MLPNHSPLVVAEQFGTLESLYPERIDLGLGRAPGTDQATAFAMRRNMSSFRTRTTFRAMWPNSSQYFSNAVGGVRAAIPGEGLHVPIPDLGLEPAVRCAACRHAGAPVRLRLAFCAANDDKEAITLYRERFASLHPQQLSKTICDTRLQRDPCQTPTNRRSFLKLPLQQAFVSL